MVIIASYVLLGFFLVIAVFFASGLTPKLIHVNYDSISAADEMRSSWTALHDPDSYPEKNGSQWKEQFENALLFEEGNITESGEKESVEKIRKLWNDSQNRLSEIKREDFSQMLKLLDQLILVNEKGMFSLASESRQLSRRIFFCSLAFFFVTVLLTILLADNLSNRLAKPIKEIAEILRSKPDLKKKLRLPEPNTLEFSILAKELTLLWEQLSDLEKLNLKQLVMQRNQLETVLSSIEDGMIVLNNEEKVILCNEGITRILGLESGQILNQSWKDLPALNENYLKLREILTPDIPSFSSVELKIEGIRLVFAARYRIILGEENEQIGSLFLLHDITQKSRMQTLKEEFISVLSHELKTPIQSLGTAAELLVSRKDQMEENTKILIETIHEDASRIRAIANDFIQVGKEAHSLKLYLEKTSLNRLLPEWIKPFRILANEKEIEIRLKIPATKEYFAHIDLMKFPWVLSNLLSNAIRISPAHSSIEISLGSDKENIHLEVADEGPGIPSDIQKKIFEPYYQGPKMEGFQTRGFLGIGLTIAKELVEAHEGKLEYFSRQPKGSLFRIKIPSAG